MLSQIVNIGRSMPFIILMVALIPITRMLVGTSLGWQAACVPLTIGAIPFYARLVETAINDVDHGKVEAALMMGASGLQITWGVLVREALPILIQSATVTIITLLGYSAMAGAVAAAAWVTSPSSTGTSATRWTSWSSPWSSSSSSSALSSSSATCSAGW